MSNSDIRNRSKQEMSNADSSHNIPKSNTNVKSSNDLTIRIRIASSICLGIVFGYLMNKANVYLAPTIRDQMIFKRFAMFKMFLAAVGMSMLSVAIITFINQAIYQKVLHGFIQRNNRIDALQLMIGGSLIGVGMVLAGSCPGTVFVQIGSGLPNSILTSAGACVGVLFYYFFLHNHLTKTELPKSSLVLQQVSELIGLNRTYINIIFGLIFISISFLLEHLIPFEKDLMQPNKISLVSWSPVWCGIGIGLLQLVFIILFEKSLGISTGFTVLVAQLCRIDLFKTQFPLLESFAYGIQNNLTLLFSIGAILGSFIAAYSTNQFPLDEKYGANKWNSFLGGFFLLIGARCAGGCTSGQGISGLTHLLIGSFIATAAMFAGGISFAVTYGLTTKDWQFNSL